jgi:ADP-ribosylglycohydrolase
MDYRSRITGSLIGLAVGDALGAPLEFTQPGSFARVTDFIGGGSFGLAPGAWTDDTSMALCLAESLIETRTFDLKDQLERYLRWYRTGHLSCTGDCFDIGITTREALEDFERTRVPCGGSTAPNAAGNGPLMRLAPVPLAFYRDPQQAIGYSGASAKTTHGLPVCVDACRYFGGLIVGALQGVPKEKLLAPLYSPVGGYWKTNPPDPAVEQVARGSFWAKEPPEIVGSGYVVRSLEAALWAFSRGSDFEEGCILAVNLCNDADTTGAIYGQLAGAYYGIEGIPERWRKGLVQYELVEEFARKLVALSEQIPDR